MADDMTEEMNNAIEWNRRRFAEDRKEINALHDELLDVIEEYVRRNVGGQLALDAIERLRGFSHMGEK